MPRGDGTGPMGNGPISGRGRGFRNRICTTGQPFSQRYSPTPYAEPVDQKTLLENQADALESELKQIRDRLGQLEEDN